MMKRQRDAEAELNLPPGFRFHPTDDELVVHYLYRKVLNQSLPVPIIAEINLYKYDPWKLPEKALFGTKEWYFFTPRDRKYPNGSRPNRAAGSGYWKATGADKPIKPSGYSTNVGIKKALVFYTGKAPKGIKTNWIMHEYRLAETNRSSKKNGSLKLDNWVLCRLYNKKNNWEIPPSESKLPHIEENVESIVTGSDSLMSLESDLVNDFHSEDEDGSKSTSIDNFQMELKDEEEDDWLMGLSLDDLLYSFDGFESSSMATHQDMTINNQIGYSVSDLFSPQMKPFWNS